MSIQAIPRFLWEECSRCPNQGFILVGNIMTGHQEREQCEFCYSNPNSVFNQEQLINAGNDEYDEDSLPL